MLALAASGWGAIVAAVLCPHANMSAARTLKAESMTDAHASRAAKTENAAKPHCHDSAPKQEATADMEMPQAPAGDTGGAAALSLPSEVPCTHCIGRQEIPASTVIARTAVEQKRSLEPAITQAATLAVPSLSFTQPVINRQGAPPGSHTPKHLLIGVLLI